MSLHCHMKNCIVLTTWSFWECNQRIKYAYPTCLFCTMSINELAIYRSTARYYFYFIIGYTLRWGTFFICSLIFYISLSCFKAERILKFFLGLNSWMTTLALFTVRMNTFLRSFFLQVFNRWSWSSKQAVEELLKMV